MCKIDKLGSKAIINQTFPLDSLTGCVIFHAAPRISNSPTHTYPFVSLLAVDADLRHAVQQLEETRRRDLGLGVVGRVGGSPAEGGAAGHDGGDDPAAGTHGR